MPLYSAGDTRSGAATAKTGGLGKRVASSAGSKAGAKRHKVGGTGAKSSADVIASWGAL